MQYDSTASVNTSNLAEVRDERDAGNMEQTAVRLEERNSGADGRVAENVTPDVLGEVKWFNNQKGYGFIVHGESPDIFVHHSAIDMDGYRTLKQGEEVHFDLVSTNKGLQAVNVRRTR